MSNLQDGFDLCAIYRHFRPAEHKVWFDYRKAQQDRAQKRRSLQERRRSEEENIGDGLDQGKLSMSKAKSMAPGAASGAPKAAKPEECEEE